MSLAIQLTSSYYWPKFELSSTCEHLWIKFFFICFRPQMAQHQKPTNDCAKTTKALQQAIKGLARVKSKRKRESYLTPVFTTRVDHTLGSDASLQFEARELKQLAQLMSCKLFFFSFAVVASFLFCFFASREQSLAESAYRYWYIPNSPFRYWYIFFQMCK